MAGTHRPIDKMKTIFLVPLLLISCLFAAGCKTKSHNFDQTEFAPRLIVPLKFADFTVSSISQEGARSLLNSKVNVGSSDTNAYHFLPLNNTNILVETVNEYRNAKLAGFSAQTTADISTESWFIEADQVLSFMEQAQPSKRSLFTARDLKYLPVSLLNWNGSDEHAELIEMAGDGMTLNDCTGSHAKHQIHALKFKDNGIKFSDGGCDYNVSELCRGDFDGDGFEDALVFVVTYYRGGSGRAYQCWVVSKTTADKTQLKLKASVR